MARQTLKDEDWPKLKSILLGQGVYDKPDLRTTVEGILHRIRVGCPWRDIPEVFGHWNSVYKRFRAWSQKGTLMRVFQALVRDPDREWIFIDGTYTKAHQHSAGAPGSDPQAIGKSRAGQTTKIHLLVDAFGLPNYFQITGGDVADCTVAPELIVEVPDAAAVVGDKGYDSEEIRQKIAAQDSEPVIPRRRNSTKGNDDVDFGLLLG
jgi:transposase